MYIYKYTHIARFLSLSQTSLFKMGLFFSKCISTSLSKIEFFFSKFKSPENIIHISSTSSSSSSSESVQLDNNFLHDARLPPSPQPPSISPESPTAAAPQPAPIGPILGKPIVDIASLYDLGEELGKGTSGITYLCTEKSTGLKYACKAISKTELDTETGIKRMRREIMILQHLAGQPNIVECKGAYEDGENLYLVMELCSGGNLCDRIDEKLSYSEKEAAGIMRQIMNVIHACHSMGVMHRDVKPKNFLMVSRDEDSPLKAIGFEISDFIETGKVYKDILGTILYAAPEMLRGEYGKEIDVWGAGVILYILLCKRFPFYSNMYIGTLVRILKNEVDLESDPWPSISESAKDLVKRMLIKDPNQRITVAEVLEHPWLKKDGKASNRTINIDVLNRLALALKVIAENPSEEKIKDLRQILIEMDMNRDGLITSEEARACLMKLGSTLSEAQIQQLVEDNDVDKNGKIDYIAFISATMRRYILNQVENLDKAFRHFDKDNSGYITRDELIQATTQFSMGNEATIDNVLQDANIDKDGKINYNEFVTIMRKRAVDFGEQLRTH